jgi:hypothetical protein
MRDECYGCPLLMATGNLGARKRPVWSPVYALEDHEALASEFSR